MKQNFRQTIKEITDSTSSLVCRFFAFILYVKFMNKVVLINGLSLMASANIVCHTVEKQSGNGKPTQPLESARGQTLYMLTKHLLNICRGLFLEFIFSSPQVPMLSLLLRYRGYLNTTQLCILETYIKYKISNVS